MNIFISDTVQLYNYRKLVRYLRKMQENKNEKPAN